VRECWLWRVRPETTCELLRVACNSNLDQRPRQTNATGKSRKTLSTLSRKNIPLAPSGKSLI
jgi:hypothetical protein